ncbi:hypothetical protein U9M48_014709 [Paspalum notatum var. saurae]|uniref:Uncharacterized protein n=1 Tax=Paspalum notatum var. saurae TaxID=547442 RepID=A0AAQ3T290_PASNO
MVRGTPCKETIFAIYNSAYTCLYGEKMGRFREPVDNHPYGIITLTGARQTHHEIHVYIFPLPSRDVQGLKHTARL